MKGLPKRTWPHPSSRLSSTRSISGLACGKPIRGHVAFLGGPLHFLSELRAAFVRTLELDDEHTIAPNHSHLFAAIGSAMNSNKDLNVSLQELQDPSGRQDQDGV